MKKYVLVIVSLLFAFNINAQTASEVFKEKFPELNSALKPNGSTKVTNDNVGLFRAQYIKLQTAKEEVEMFKFGGFPVEGGEIFEDKELKSLKKDDQLIVLENLIHDSILKMKLFLGSKTKLGADTMECYEQYSNFKMRMKQKDYKAACGFWRELMMYYPMSFSGVYSNGDVLMRKKIQMVTNDAKKVGDSARTAYKAEKFDESKVFVEQQKELMTDRELWIDTLLLLYDKRIEFFGNDKKYGTAYSQGKKGSYLYKYRKDTALSEAYELLEKSILVQKEKSRFTTIKVFFDVSVDMVKAGNIGAEKLVTDYNIITGFLKESTDKYTKYIEKEKKKSKPNAKKIATWKKIVSSNDKVSTYITGKFAKSDFSKCEYLVPAFKKTFDKNKSDIEWLEKILGILKWKECTQDPFYLVAAKELYNLKPSANSAAMIAIGELKKENYPEAGKYFEEAYNGEEDIDKKAEYYYYGAVVAFAQGQKSKSRTLALKAAELKESYGKPYVLIAKLYAASAGSCGKDNFDKATVYWAAVDKLIKAKSISKDEKVIAEASKLINKYSSRYPSQEEGFMRGIYAGNSVIVGCWINVTTKARY